MVVTEIVAVVCNAVAVIRRSSVASIGNQDIAKIHLYTSSPMCTYTML